jgi:hypothetical protein
MVKTIAMIFGVVFILVALLGFMATGMSNMDSDPATAPRVLGLFPVNVLHNVVHLLFGIWGVVSARSFAGARTYCMTAGVIYLVLAALGFIAPTTFGLIPIGGNDIWLHALLGVALLGAGMTAKDSPPATA